MKRNTEIPCKLGQGYVHFEEPKECVFCNPPAVTPSTPEAGELERVVAQAMNGPNTELPTRIRAAILSYSQAESSRADRAEIKLKSANDELDAAWKVLAEAQMPSTDYIANSIEALVADRDMWLKDDAKQNAALGRQIARAEQAEAALDAAKREVGEKWESVSDYEKPPSGYIQIPDDAIGVLKYRHQGQYGDDRQLMKLELAALAAKSTEPKEG